MCLNQPTTTTINKILSLTNNMARGVIRRQLGKDYPRDKEFALADLLGGAQSIPYLVWYLRNSGHLGVAVEYAMCCIEKVRPMIDGDNFKASEYARVCQCSLQQLLGEDGHVYSFWGVSIAVQAAELADDGTLEILENELRRILS